MQAESGAELIEASSVHRGACSHHDGLIGGDLDDGHLERLATIVHAAGARGQRRNPGDVPIEAYVFSPGSGARRKPRSFHFLLALLDATPACGERGKVRKVRERAMATPPSRHSLTEAGKRRSSKSGAEEGGWRRLLWECNKLISRPRVVDCPGEALRSEAPSAAPSHASAHPRGFPAGRAQIAARQLRRPTHPTAWKRTLGTRASGRTVDAARCASILLDGRGGEGQGELTARGRCCRLFSERRASRRSVTMQRSLCAPRAAPRLAPPARSMATARKPRRGTFAQHPADDFPRLRRLAVRAHSARCTQSTLCSARL